MLLVFQKSEGKKMEGGRMSEHIKSFNGGLVEVTKPTMASHIMTCNKTHALPDAKASKLGYEIYIENTHRGFLNPYSPPALQPGT